MSRSRQSPDCSGHLAALVPEMTPISGHRGDEKISGGDGGDTIFGNVGSDLVFGSKGEDTLLTLSVCCRGG
ncbi:hypothetical protein [Streptomyces syringium]|uniref:hypothetical protein n=1 Tax=Streptomyces syringium TaxID=76729 RepID=UPI0033F411F1